MSDIRYRSAAIARRLPFLFCVLALGILGFVLPWHATPTSPPGVTPRASDTPPSFDDIDALIRSQYAKRLDVGTIELWQVHAQEPVAWVWVQDSTLDGQGAEYHIHTTDFHAPTPQNDQESITYDYVEGVQHQTLAACLAWIVQNYTHIQDVDDLAVSRHQVSPVE